jgi:hypothetical protein
MMCTCFLQKFQSYAKALISLIEPHEDDRIVSVYGSLYYTWKCVVASPLFMSHVNI